MGKYLRNIIQFRGVGIPEIRNQLALWRDEYGIAMWDKQDQLLIALRIFESPIAEDKLADILFLQEYRYDRFDWKVLLQKYEDLYLRGLIFDWNTCDWFCVRDLGPTIAKNGLTCAEALSAWNPAGNLWQALSSVVAFVPVSADGCYYPLIYEYSHALIQRDERFAKTAAEWILRDLSKHDKDAVLLFVMSHLENLSLEAIKNGLNYFTEPERNIYVQRLKDA